VGAEIHIYCPTGKGGAARGDLEYDLEAFLAGNGEITGGGSGVERYNIDVELAEGADWEEWVVRIRDFLRQQEARHGTFFNVFPPDWERGMEYRRVEVYGE
jgi:hypothetical protein